MKFKGLSYDTNTSKRPITYSMKKDATGIASTPIPQPVSQPVPVIGSTMRDIFKANDSIVAKSMDARGQKRTKGPSNIEIQEALAVVLVDVAMCDQEFSSSEYHQIADGMHRMFGTQKNDSQKLIHQAKLVLGNMRGCSRQAEILKTTLSDSDRAVILEIIDNIIAADGKEDGYEK